MMGVRRGYPHKNDRLTMLAPYVTYNGVFMVKIMKGEYADTDTGLLHKYKYTDTGLI